MCAVLAVYMSVVVCGGGVVGCGGGVVVCGEPQYREFRHKRSEQYYFVYERMRITPIRFAENI